MIFDGNAPTNPPKCVYVCTNHFTPDCFLNEGQFKAGFVKKLKLKDGSVPIVCDPAAPSEVVSLTLYIFLWQPYHPAAQDWFPTEAKQG